MNKKLIYAFILFFTGMMITVGYTNAQVCAPDPQYTQPGIYPDSITNLDSGIVNIAYSDTITVIVPLDTISSICPCGGCIPCVDIDSIVLTNITGLPPGLSYQCVPPSCAFPGGTSGCVLISGTPTVAGTYNLLAFVAAYVQCHVAAFGCSTISSTQEDTIKYYTIVIILPLSASITASTDVDCKGNCTGQATVTALDGTPPYTYLWDDSLAQATATATGLCRGNYTVTVNDANNDTVIVSVTIDEPANDLLATVTSTDETGPGSNDGTAKVVATGGTPPYAYLWSPGGATTDSIGGLAPGSYNVTVTDTNGCTFVGTAIVNPVGCNLGITISSTDETSAGSKDGTATVIVSGGTPPYTYNWGIDTIVTMDSVSTIVGLAPGNYSVTITDSIPCSKGAGPVNVADGPVGIKPFEGLTNRILVYPNPAANELNIITSFDEQVVFK